MLLILFAGVLTIQGLIFIALAGQTQNLDLALAGVNSLLVAFWSVFLRILFNFYDNYLQ